MSDSKLYQITVNTDNGLSRFGRKDVAVFGGNNNGVIVHAENEKHACEVLNAGLLPGLRYNPAYLKLKMLSFENGFAKL
jgi:hypothetical protein